MPTFEQLEKTLAEVDLFFEHAQLTSLPILIGQTIKSIRQGELAGSAIYVGILSNQFPSPGSPPYRQMLRTLDEYGKDIELTSSEIRYTSKTTDIPVVMMIIPRGKEFFVYPDPYFYQYTFAHTHNHDPLTPEGSFLQPNPVRGYLTGFDSEAVIPLNHELLNMQLTHQQRTLK